MLCCTKLMDKIMHDLCILWYHVLKGSGFRGFAANDDDDPFQISPHFQPASSGVSNWGASFHLGCC